MQATINQGKRCSTSKAFLAPAMKRKNLTVKTNALVTKVGITIFKIASVKKSLIEKQNKQTINQTNKQTNKQSNKNHIDH